MTAHPEPPTPAERAGDGTTTCDATLNDRSGPVYHCEKPAGHDGPHRNFIIAWPASQRPAASPVGEAEALRKDNERLRARVKLLQQQRDAARSAWDELEHERAALRPPAAAPGEQCIYCGPAGELCETHEEEADVEDAKAANAMSRAATRGVLRAERPSAPPTGGEGALREVLEAERRARLAFRFYVCASDEELREAGVARGEALQAAYAADDFAASLPVPPSSGTSAERERLDERIHETMLTFRGVETPCTVCDGWGRRVYSSSATWRGGMGGQTMCGDVCDHCWGSGDEHRHGTDLRKLTRELAALRSGPPSSGETPSEGVREDAERYRVFRDWLAMGGVIEGPTRNAVDTFADKLRDAARLVPPGGAETEAGDA